MPFTNRGRLLARLAALLLLGSAVAGCQTTSAVYRGYSYPEPGPTLSEPPLQPVPADSSGLVAVQATEPAPAGLPAVNTALPPITSPPYAAAPAPVTQSNTLAPPAVAPAKPAGANVRYFPGPSSSKGLLGSLFGRPTNQEPPRLAPTPMRAVPCRGPGCPSAVMLRPVPSSESGYVPAQRPASPDSVAASYVPVTRPTDVPAVDTSVAA